MVVPKIETISIYIEVVVQQFPVIRLAHILVFIIVLPVQLNLDAKFNGTNKMAIAKALSAVQLVADHLN